MSMPQTLERVRAITLADIQGARTRIAKTIVRTPLLRFEMGPDYPDILLKLENLQPTNPYHQLGAVNAVAPLSDSDRTLGGCTITEGNAGKGIPDAARKAG